MNMLKNYFIILGILLLSFAGYVSIGQDDSANGEGDETEITAEVEGEPAADSGETPSESPDAADPVQHMSADFSWLPDKNEEALARLTESAKNKISSLIKDNSELLYKTEFTIQVKISPLKDEINKIRDEFIASVNSACDKDFLDKEPYYQGERFLSDPEIHNGATFILTDAKFKSSINNEETNYVYGEINGHRTYWSNDLCNDFNIYFDNSSYQPLKHTEKALSLLDSLPKVSTEDKKSLLKDLKKENELLLKENKILKGFVGEVKSYLARMEVNALDERKKEALEKIEEKFKDAVSELIDKKVRIIASTKNVAEIELSLSEFNEIKDKMLKECSKECSAITGNEETGKLSAERICHNVLQFIDVYEPQKHLISSDTLKVLIARSPYTIRFYSGSTLVSSIWSGRDMLEKDICNKFFKEGGK